MLSVVAGVPRKVPLSVASPICAAHSASLLTECIMDDDWDTDMLWASCKGMAKRLRARGPCKAAKRKPSPPRALVAKHKFKHAARVPAAKACETRKGAFAEACAAVPRPHAVPVPPKRAQKKGKRYTVQEIRWPKGFKKRLKALVERSLTTEKNKAYDRAAELSNFRLASQGTPIRFGSDCSGMECFTEAFKRLGLSNRLIVEFCSDTDETCRLWLRHQSLKAKKFYDDLRARPLGEGAGMDIYAAGFPCQPWSSAGKGEGEADAQGRGEVFWSILKHIAHD